MRFIEDIRSIPLYKIEEELLNQFYSTCSSIFLSYIYIYIYRYYYTATTTSSRLNGNIYGKLEWVTVVKEFQARAMNIMAGKANLVAEVIIIVVIIIMIVSVFVEVDKEELFKLVYIPVNIIRVKHAVAKLETHTMIKCVAKMMTVIVMTTQGIMIIIVILVVVRMELPKLILLPMVSAIVVMAMAMVTIRLQYFLTEFFHK